MKDHYVTEDGSRFAVAIGGGASKTGSRTAAMATRLVFPAAVAAAGALTLFSLVWTGCFGLL